MRFAKRLRELREKAGLTQEALARAADMSIGNVRNYEQGIREPRWQGIFKLADALGVDCCAFKECVDAELEEAIERAQQLEEEEAAERAQAAEARATMVEIVREEAAEEAAAKKRRGRPKR